MLPRCFRRFSDGRVRLVVNAKPNAKRTRVVGFDNEAVVLAITSPPVDGKANKELTEYIASILGVKKKDVTLDKGDKSRNKLFILNNVTADMAYAKFKDEL
mmetsp:Transcript_26911/g.30010  ORF Transcript_26911/g.30010 Transcript_26911/m.30010 type:complete len:101 (-) Transcript_26911:107-409(-)